MNKLPSPQTEIVLSSMLLVLLGIIFNPFSMQMTKMTTMIIVSSLIIVFGLFTLFGLREQPRDEREELLMVKTSRFVYLITGFSIVAGISYQLVQHTIDYWLLYIFAIMILSKLLGYIVIQRKS